MFPVHQVRASFYPVPSKLVTDIVGGKVQRLQQPSVPKMQPIPAKKATQIN